MTNKNKLENFEDLLLGKFLDPIHGVIRITKLEKKIIDHPLFQRLRDIRQNTFLYKVFPSAMHSRFEHSVGVMHLSYEILKNIERKKNRCYNDCTENFAYEGNCSNTLEIFLQ